MRPVPDFGRNNKNKTAFEVKISSFGKVFLPTVFHNMNFKSCMIMNFGIGIFYVFFCVQIFNPAIGYSDFFKKGVVGGLSVDYFHFFLRDICDFRLAVG